MTHARIADDEAGIHQRQRAGREVRRIADLAVGAVGGNPGGTAAVEFQTLAIDERVGNARAVLGLGKQVLGLVGADVDRRLGLADVSARVADHKIADRARGLLSVRGSPQMVLSMV